MDPLQDQTTPQPADAAAAPEPVADPAPATGQPVVAPMEPVDAPSPIQPLDGTDAGMVAPSPADDDAALTDIPAVASSEPELPAAVESVAPVDPAAPAPDTTVPGPVEAPADPTDTSGDQSQVVGGSF